LIDQAVAYKGRAGCVNFGEGVAASGTKRRAGAGLSAMLGAVRFSWALLPSGGANQTAENALQKPLTLYLSVGI